jgi:hypothetical protein
MAPLYRDLLDLLERNPFQPFCIKLVNGDHHNIFYPRTVSLLRRRAFVASPDGEWVVFPFDKIASIESLYVEPGTSE